MKKIIFLLSLIYFISSKDDCLTLEAKNSEQCLEKDTEDTLCCYFEGKYLGLKKVKACCPIPRIKTNENDIKQTAATLLKFTIEDYLCKANFQKIGLFLFMILFIL